MIGFSKLFFHFPLFVKISISVYKNIKIFSVLLVNDSELSSRNVSKQAIFCCCITTYVHSTLRTACRKMIKRENERIRLMIPKKFYLTAVYTLYTSTFSSLKGNIHIIFRWILRARDRDRDILTRLRLGH